METKLETNGWNQWQLPTRTQLPIALTDGASHWTQWPNNARISKNYPVKKKAKQMERDKVASTWTQLDKLV